MSDAFLISDIDDSEGDELSGEYKQDTINVPDQATNSDAYIDYKNPRAKKSDFTIPNTNQNINSKENNETNTNEDQNDSNDDLFTYKKDTSNDENEEESDEDIFFNKSDENDESKDEIQNKKDESDNEEEEEINSKPNQKEEKDDNKDYEARDKINSDEDNNNDSSNEEISENNEFSDSISEEEENDDREGIMSNAMENVRESFFNADDEKEEHYNGKEESYDKKDILEETYKEEEDSNEDTFVNNEKENDDENINKKEKEEENNNLKVKNDEVDIDESVDFANESNDFGDESYIGPFRSNNHSDYIKNFDESRENKHDNISGIKEENDERNKDDENIIEENSKEENTKENKDDSSDVKPITEPLSKRNEKPRPHRHSHSKTKEKIKKNEEITEQENEEDNQQKEDINPSKTVKKRSKKAKNNQETESKPEKNHSDHTIDEIADLSINNGDYSLLNQSNIEKVMSKMRQKQRDALEIGDYELAERAQLAAQSAIRYYNERQLLKHNSNRACEINIQLEQTRSDISFLQEHWARVLENAKQRANEDLLQLRNEQDLQLKEFDDEYQNVISNPNENLPIKYRKFSSTVLVLKKKQEVYINTNNFKMAKSINKEIKMLEEKEKKENILRYQKKKIAERNHMIKKQDEMFSVRKDNWIRTIEGIRSVATYEIEHAKKSAKQLETKFMQTNEFSNKLIKQQQKRTSSLQPTTDKQSISQSIPNSPREDTKTVTHTQFTIQRNAHKMVQQEFRERAMINRIIYTNRVVPKVKKPIPMRRTKKQYARTPR